MLHLVSVRRETGPVTPKEDRITTLHGAGGEVMGRLLDRMLSRFARPSVGRIGLLELDDGATVDLTFEGELVITTDSHVVKPIFFPGGDIGRLAAAGTINDLAVMGARPLALTLAAVIEEGFLIDDLERILDSFAATLDEVGAALICGDTKVMPAGELDGIVLNTTGLAVADRAVSDAEISVGDRVLLTGTIGDHGMALLAAREEFHLQTPLESDVAAIWPLIEVALRVGGVRAMKDPTRGGLAAALNEMARKANLTIEIVEAAIPVRDEVRGLSEILGISPMDVANEGKAILIIDPGHTDAVLAALQRHPLGKAATVIGTVTEEYPGRVVLATEVTGRRFLDMPLGDPVPRIC
jgi:hydrogenase expression/formation protein HypE